MGRNLEERLTMGTENYKGFQMDNVLHSDSLGEIHYHIYVPDSYDGSEPFSRGTETARSVHMLCAYWGFVFMSLHLGFHWNMIIAMAGKAFLIITSLKFVDMWIISNI